MSQKILILILAAMTLAGELSLAESKEAPKVTVKKKVIYKKTQEVNFEEASIDGQARTPDAAYLNQKRGVKFLPLYKVKKEFDRGIRESVDYLR